MHTGVASAMVGMKVGETREVQLTLPDNFEPAALRGVPVTCQVGISELFEYELAEVRALLATVQPCAASEYTGSCYDAYWPFLVWSGLVPQSSPVLCCFVLSYSVPLLLFFSFLFFSFLFFSFLFFSFLFFSFLFFSFFSVRFFSFPFFFFFSFLFFSQATIFNALHWDLYRLTVCKGSCIADAQLHLHASVLLATATCPDLYPLFMQATASNYIL